MDESQKKELQDLLFPYLQKALKDNPKDYVSHAADYFTSLREEKNPKEEGSMEYIQSKLGAEMKFKRRASVMGESYNPEADDDTEEIEIVPKTDEQRNRIKSQCQEIFLFSAIDDTDLSAVIDVMMPIPVTKGKVVIRQGDDGDFFYLIDRGKFRASIKDTEDNDKTVANYADKGYFGELALLYNQPRAATITAESEGLLWAVTRKNFNKLIVKRAFEKRKMYVELLDQVPELKPLTDYEKMQVADALTGSTFNSGDVIVKEEDEGDGMYFIVQGTVSVRQKKALDDGEQDEEISQLGKGKFFGELALVKHQPRAATVTAIEDDTKVAFLEVKAFERLLGPCMDVMKRHTETYKKNN